MRASSVSLLRLSGSCGGRREGGRERREEGREGGRREEGREVVGGREETCNM